MRSKHIPVMENEVLEFLITESGGIYLDCTLGLGGHACKILNAISPHGRLVGIDIDPNALEIAKRNLVPYENRTCLIHGNFTYLDQILSQFGVSQVDGVLMDLGFSSYQIEDPARGFSIRRSGPLDMRFNQADGNPVSKDLDEKSRDELAKIFHEFGEERFSRKIADKIVEVRKNAPISTTTQLAEIVESVVPRLSQGIHPATRVFQSLRIYKNNELTNLQIGIEKAVSVLKPRGRICIISFHSLEDRIVKRMYRSMERGCICPPKTPVCICGKKPLLRVITRSPLVPKDEEIKVNPRSRSAKLRVAERL